MSKTCIDVEINGKELIKMSGDLSRIMEYDEEIINDAFDKYIELPDLSVEPEYWAVWYYKGKFPIEFLNKLES